MSFWRRYRVELIGFGILALLPLLIDPKLGGEIRIILIFCILALGLNVVVGYSGLLQLGIAAFFAIGAYVMGIFTVTQFPFQIGFWPGLVAATVGAGIAGVVLAAPTLRLRGDYLAIVTLGFGEVVKFAIKNLENITNGSRPLNGLPLPWGSGPDTVWTHSFHGYYYLALALLGVVVALLYNLENSRLGRAWMAIREDELAASCMGISAPKVKLSAFALGSALAGLGGALYSTTLDTTGGPDAYTFNRSITVLCFLIIGGMGNIRGALLGTLVLMGYDNILTPRIDQWLQTSNPESTFRFSDIKLIIFGLVLVLMMRFRPEGLVPSRRIQMELHEVKG